MSNIRTICLRFNLDKPLHRKAYDYLQSIDKSVFKSYTQAAAQALTEYFQHYYNKCADPYLETREREEQFVEQIVTEVGVAVKKSMPGFMAAYITNLAQPYQQPIPLAAETEPDLSDIDLDFIGG